MSNENSDTDKASRLWRYYQHADNLAATRTSFFLVAESMLLLGYVATFSASEPGVWALRLGLVGLALLYTFSWFVMNHNILTKMLPTGKRLKVADTVYEDYLEPSEALPSFVIHHYIQSWTPVVGQGSEPDK